MRITLKRMISLCIMAVIFASLLLPGFKVSAATFYGEYDGIAAVPNSNGCGIMQGMAVGSTCTP